MGMELPTLPEGYFWDHFIITAPKGVVAVTHLRKRVLGIFSKAVGAPKHEAMFYTADAFPETHNWAADTARGLEGK